MTLADACGGTTAEAFERSARHVGLRRDTGLAGIVWDTGMPLFIDDLGHRQRFLRAPSATKVAINQGLAIPCANPGQGTRVLAFLSALRIKAWRPDSGPHRRASGGRPRTAIGVPGRRCSPGASAPAWAMAR